MTQDQIIEVEIKDSIACKIDMFQYKLSVYIGEGSTLLDKYLADNNIQYDKALFTIADINYLEYIVDFHSWAQVEALKQISEDQSVEIAGEMLGTFHELTADEIDILYKKILESSTLEASKIAKVMGNKDLGEIRKIRYNANAVVRGTWRASPPFVHTKNNKIYIPKHKADTMQKERTLVIQYNVV